MGDALYEEPVIDVCKKIINTEKNKALLVGKRGSGKSSVLDYLCNIYDPKHFFINVTVSADKYLPITDLKVYRLYYTVLILQELSKYISNYTGSSYYINYDFLLHKLLYNIKIMYIVHDYSKKEQCIPKSLLNNPYSLINEFLRLFEKINNEKKITLVIDDIDAVGLCSEVYQSFIFKDISKYFNILVSTSDSNILKSKSITNSYEVCNITYSEDLDTVLNILNTSLMEDEFKIGYKTRFEFLFSKDTPKKLINKCNGNLIKIKYSLKIFLFNIDNLKKEEYEDYILKVPEDKVTFYSPLKRTLKI